MPRRVREEVHAGLRDVFQAPDRATAQERVRRWQKRWEKRFPELVEWLEETIAFALAVYEVPPKHRRRLRTTHGLERFLREIRRRSRVVGWGSSRTGGAACGW